MERKRDGDKTEIKRIKERGILACVHRFLSEISSPKRPRSFSYNPSARLYGTSKPWMRAIETTGSF